MDTALPATVAFAAPLSAGKAAAAASDSATAMVTAGRRLIHLPPGGAGPRRARARLILARKRSRPAGHGPCGQGYQDRLGEVSPDVRGVQRAEAPADVGRQRLCNNEGCGDHR